MSDTLATFDAYTIMIATTTGTIHNTVDGKTGATAYAKAKLAELERQGVVVREILICEGGWMPVLHWNRAHGWNDGAAPANLESKENLEQLRADLRTSVRMRSW